MGPSAMSLRTKSNQFRNICWLAALLVFYSSTAHAIDDLFGLLHCKKAEPASTTEGIVALRLYPLAVKQLSIPANGISLSAFIAETDLVASALAHKQWNELRSSVPSANVRGRLAQSEPVQPPTHLYADPKTPDTMILGRGNQVVVFPRVLLLYPSVANHVVRDGDVVASVYLKPIAETQTDPLRKLLPNHEATDSNAIGSSKIAITLAGGLMPTEARGSHTIEQMPLSAYLEYVKFSGNDQVSRSNLETIVRTRMEEQLTNVLPVCTVTRRVGGLKIQYVSPLRDTGLFGMNGALMKSLYSSTTAVNADESKVQRNRWYRLFGDRLYSVPLTEGDVVEFGLFAGFWNPQG